jgi:hypothetical protein
MVEVMFVNAKRIFTMVMVFQVIDANIKKMLVHIFYESNKTQKTIQALSMVQIKKCSLLLE